MTKTVDTGDWSNPPKGVSVIERDDVNGNRFRGLHQGRRLTCRNQQRPDTWLLSFSEEWWPNCSFFNRVSEALSFSI